MTNRTLANILKDHGINYEIINGRVIAEDHYTINGVPGMDTIDVTDMSKRQLLDWLGY